METLHIRFLKVVPLLDNLLSFTNIYFVPFEELKVPKINDELSFIIESCKIYWSFTRLWVSDQGMNNYREIKAYYM